jgi:glycosyltransferase involved in cell wall biosynthesis
MSLRVLHVIDTSEIGGGQTAVRHLIEGFRGTDVTTDLACRDGGPLIDAARRHGAMVHAIPFDKRYLPNRAAALARVIDARRIDLLHTHGLLATYYGELARRLGRRVPLVYHQHGFHHHNHGRLTQRARIAAEKWLAGHADAVIPVSSSDRDQLLAQGYATDDKVRLIYYGMSHRAPQPEAVEAARRALGVDAGTRVVGLVARLVPQKGVDTFIRAIEIVRRSRRDVVFAIVGVGPLEVELRALAEARGFRGDLRWVTDGTPGVAAMRWFSIGVLSSRWEGLPLVLLEYMASGIPVVTTNVQGCRDAVTAQHAELVEPDDPAALAAAIERLLADPDRARCHAAAARARFEEVFTLDVMTHQVRALYREVCQ